jgi:hypothetical protein
MNSNGLGLFGTLLQDNFISVRGATAITGTGTGVLSIFGCVVVGNAIIASTVNTSTNLVVVDSNFIEVGGENIHVTLVAFAASPYSCIATDFYISVDSSGGAITINLPTNPLLGRHIIVVDGTGHAATNNIRVSGGPNNIVASGGVPASTSAITNNYGSLDMFYNGTLWIIA